MVKPILLDALRERLTQQVPRLDDLPESVWRRTSALNTWGTNAIEGNTLDREDVEELLMAGRSVAGRPAGDVMETIQHERAFRGLTQRAQRSIDLVTVVELHEEVFRGSPTHRPGQWRNSNVRIAGVGHRPPNHTRVVAAMTGWIDTLAYDGDVWLEAARMHQTLEEIHPFQDGNGRVGRLLLNLWLLRRGWPPLHITPEDRRAYLHALRTGNAGDIEPLAALLRDAMARSLLDLLDQVGDEDDALLPLAQIQQHGGFAAGYLALRARQGVLPAIHATQTSAPPQAMRHAGRPRWLTSRWALGLWQQHHTRRP